MSKVRITAIKSVIDRSKRQKATVSALGLRKLNQSIEVEKTAQIDGMIKAVQHLVKVENI